MYTTKILKFIADCDMASSMYQCISNVCIVLIILKDKSGLTVSHNYMHWITERQAL